MATAKTIEKSEDLETTIQRVIETAPSHEALKAEAAKLTGLGLKRAAVVTEIDRLVKEHEAERNALSAGAEALLAGREAPDASFDDAMRAMFRRRGTLDEAINVQQRTILNLRSRVSHEVNAALRSVRQPLVAKMAAALRVLREAAEEDSRLRALVGKNGIDLSNIETLAFSPISGDCAFDQGWLEGVAQKGYTV